MAITSVNQAIDRVRLLIDKSDSPYMTNAEIGEFLDIAVAEFVQEKIDIVGATQRVRDDLGGFLREVSFISPAWLQQNVNLGANDESYLDLFGDNTYNIISSYEGNNAVSFSIEDVLNIGFIETFGQVEPTEPTAQDSGILDFGNLISITIRRPSDAFIDAFGEGAALTYWEANIGEEAVDENDFGGPVYTPVKIIELDDITTINEDPFNKPDSNEYKAIRIENRYEIYPSEDFIREEAAHLAQLRPNLFRIIVTYVISVPDMNQDAIDRLPNHSTEEVCQIAARKIMGVLADERYNAAEAETQQMRK
jgi:hypothetical protein